MCECAQSLLGERECDACGGLQLEEALEVIKERKRWGENTSGSKDLLLAKCSVRSVLKELEDDLLSLANHLKVAHWQRRNAICTIDFAENYLCRYQNEVQSAHWSYKVSVHPFVFQYACPDCGSKVT